MRQHKELWARSQENHQACEITLLLRVVPMFNSFYRSVLSSEDNSLMLLAYLVGALSPNRVCLAVTFRGRECHTYATMAR